MHYVVYGREDEEGTYYLPICNKSILHRLTR